MRDLTAPFGGCGISGIGREGGDYALDFYSDLKMFQVLENTTDVGTRFADEARRIHYGEAPARGIRGQASREELCDILDRKVHLFLHVVVDEKWADKREFYGDVGLDYDA